MATVTETALGKIIIPEDVIGTIAGYAAVENYGIVGMKNKKCTIGNKMGKGVIVKTLDSDTVGIDLYVTIEYGVSLAVVAQNAKDNVKFRVEHLMNVKVAYVNVHVEGVRA